ncbi:hypothetical protein PGTUg99_020542 [Puccinia graminis f. sp. tritici]|uniref:Uncharacterized protein n=1 Tax=Puccinia graminis f. sp. tritici TaxID=56615 RepID=A0A5B0RT92_PUCGR|nr:hypothetical protein PGTUg99_020542 [Puccinia graminis f. sp. tritici]
MPPLLSNCFASYSHHCFFALTLPPLSIHPTPHPLFNLRSTHSYPATSFIELPSIVRLSDWPPFVICSRLCR